jgi:hypothetical protein
VSTERRVKLRGVLAHTASSASIGADGSLVVELYDFSPEAHKCLGNDVAFLLHVGPAGKDEALKLLVPSARPASASEADDLLLHAMQERFADYYDVERWLGDEGIPFRKEFDSWA